VSVRGGVFGPRKTFKISDQLMFVPGERIPHLTNELIDGSIIDLGGCLLLYKQIEPENDSIPSAEGEGETIDQSQRIKDIIRSLNDHRPQCPVLFQPLHFSESSLKDKQQRMWDYIKSAHHRPNCSRKTMAPEYFSEDVPTWQSSTPYVFSSCGHVYGYSKQLEGRYQFDLEIA
jgi:hypothetical protein